MPKTKFKGQQKPGKSTKYDYCGISFFGGDKDDLIEIINGEELPYTSFSHFIRASINTQLKEHHIDFQITEK